MTASAHLMARRTPARPPASLVSLLSANAQPFYAALAGAVTLESGLPLHFDSRPDGALDRLLAGDVPLGALCGLLYTRYRSQLEVLAAPVASSGRGQGQPVYYSDVVVRRDSAAQHVTDLRGAQWVLNEPESFSGHVALRVGLHRAGQQTAPLDRAEFSGSHLASLRRVREGLADATAVDSGVLALAGQQDPSLHRDLRVLTSFGPYTAPPVVVHRSVPPGERRQWLGALLALPDSDLGRSALRLGGIARYVAVTDADYDPVRQADHQVSSNHRGAYA